MVRLGVFSGPWGVFRPVFGSSWSFHAGGETSARSSSQGRLDAQIDADEAPQCPLVVQGVLYPFVAQAKPNHSWMQYNLSMRSAPMGG